MTPGSFQYSKVARSDVRARTGSGNSASVERQAVVPRRTIGFTLLELVAVLVIVALMASVAVVSFRGSVQAARVEDGIAEFLHADRQLREHAKRTGKPLHLLINTSVPARLSIVDARSQSSVIPSKTLARGLRITEIRIGGAAGFRGTEAGNVISIPCSPNGHTPSYAVRIQTDDEVAHGSDVAVAAPKAASAGPSSVARSSPNKNGPAGTGASSATPGGPATVVVATESRSGTGWWWIAGMTGQALRMSDERELQTTMRVASGADAR